MRSAHSVQVAAGVALAVLLVCFLVIRRTASGGSSKDRPRAKDLEGMTPLRATDEEEPLGPDDGDGDLTVHYELGDDSIDGELPLTGIRSSSELLDELAEFGCELQDDVILSVSTIEVSYE